MKLSSNAPNKALKPTILAKSNACVIDVTTLAAIYDAAGAHIQITECTNIFHILYKSIAILIYWYTYS